MEFSKTEIPTASRSGRTPLPNPFVGEFPADEKALSLTLAGGRESLEVRRLTRQARQAAKAVDRTARIMLTDVEGGVEFKVWTVEKITRQAKATVTPLRAKKAAAPAKKAAANSRKK